MTCRIRRSRPPEASSAARSKSGGHLPVDAERRVGAGVDEHLPAGVPLRVEVEAALGLPAGQVGADVADQEVVVEGLALEGEPEGRPHLVAARRRRRRRRTSRAPGPAPSAVAQVTVTPDSSCSMPVTRWPQRTSISGSAAIRSSSSCSVSHCEMLTNGGNGDLPRSANWKLNSSVSRWKVRAVVQVTPRRATSAPTPTASQTSRTSRCWQIALLPTSVALGPAVEHDDRQAPAGQQQRGGLADRAAAQDQHRGARRAEWSSPLSPAARPRPRGRAPPSRSPGARCRRARPTAAGRRRAGSARRSATCRTSGPGPRGWPRTPP